jgi:hypothetical protein
VAPAGPIGASSPTSTCAGAQRISSKSHGKFAGYRVHPELRDRQSRCRTDGNELAICLPAAADEHRLSDRGGAHGGPDDLQIDQSERCRDLTHRVAIGVGDVVR